MGTDTVISGVTPARPPLPAAPTLHKGNTSFSQIVQQSLEQNPTTTGGLSPIITPPSNNNIIERPDLPQTNIASPELAPNTIPQTIETVVPDTMNNIILDNSGPTQTHPGSSPTTPHPIPQNIETLVPATVNRPQGRYPYGESTQNWLTSIPTANEAGVFDFIEQGNRNDTIPGTLITKGEILDIIDQVNQNTPRLIKQLSPIYNDNYFALQDLMIKKSEKEGTRFINNPSWERQAQEIADELVRPLGLEGKFKIKISDEKAPGGGALPAGVILIYNNFEAAIDPNTGLLNPEKKAQLTTVIAHELGHNLHLHPDLEIQIKMEIDHILNHKYGADQSIHKQNVHALTHKYYRRATEHIADSVGIKLIENAYGDQAEDILKHSSHFMDSVGKRINQHPEAALEMLWEADHIPTSAYRVDAYTSHY